MPPKKKKSGKKKNKKKDDRQLESEDKYNKTLNEVNAVKDCLAQRHSMLVQAKTDNEVWNKQLGSLRQELQTQKSDYRSISADMTRQYKTMESEMSVRIHLLETELARYKHKLSESQAELVRVKEENKTVCRDQENEIERLEQKIFSMEGSYEAILHDSLDNLMFKIKTAKDQWEKRSRMIQAKNKKTLLEFGLNPLDL